jgi:small subunit ribosomal protein S18
VDFVDYHDPNKLKKFVTERGKILPRRISGNCARHQRTLTVAIKRARDIALMPYTADG